MSSFDFLNLPTKLDHVEFEILVKDWLEQAFGTLKKFEAKHRELLQGNSGEFEIDVLVRFEAMGANFVVLVECKHQRRAVERSVVQVLYDRIRETGAHKGIIFTTSSFQSGAIDYARNNGICLIKVADGKTAYRTKSFDGTNEPPSWTNIPPHVGWICSPGDSYRLLSINHIEYLQAILENKSND